MSREPHKIEHLTTKSGEQTAASSHTETGDGLNLDTRDVMKDFVRRYGIGGVVMGGLALSFFAVGAWAANHPDEAGKLITRLAETERVGGVTEHNPLPHTVYVTTYDSSEKDPAKRVQHKEFHLEGATTGQGNYRYLDTWMNSSGVATFYQRINGSIEVMFASSNPNGASMGYILLRPMKHTNGEATAYVGFETGHDCECGGRYVHEGPFSSVPAIMTTTQEVPEEIAKIVSAKPAIKEDFLFPPEVSSALQKLNATH